MRTLLLLGLVVGVLAVTAFASPWVAWGLGSLGWSFAFSRVWNRVLEGLLVVALVAAWRVLDLGSPRELGLARRAWAREFGRGFVVGAVGLGAGLVACWLAGALVPGLRFVPAKTLRKALLGLAGAAAIGFGEEILFRGVLLRRLARDAGTPTAVVVTTAIYAVVHALRPGRAELTGPWSGAERLATLFAPLGTAAVWPGILGLGGLGTLLAVVRLRTGSLWVTIGLHAAWVAVFRVGRLLFDLRAAPVWVVGGGWPPLVGGAAGWLALAVTAALVLRRDGRKLPPPAGPPG